jgi:hypothetical protein
MARRFDLVTGPASRSASEVNDVLSPLLVARHCSLLACRSSGTSTCANVERSQGDSSLTMAGDSCGVRGKVRAVRDVSRSIDIGPGFLDAVDCRVVAVRSISQCRGFARICLEGQGQHDRTLESISKNILPRASQPRVSKGPHDTDGLIPDNELAACLL